MSFFKYQEDIDTVLEGSGWVLNKDYFLEKSKKDTYTYPIDGWYWFDTMEEAREFFGLPPLPKEESSDSEV